MFGLNITQVIAGDMELYVKYKFHKKHSITIAGGYDFNFIDPGKQCGPEDIIAGYGEGDNTRQWVTYFYGNGPSARLWYDFIYEPGSKWEKFISISVIAKSRVYSDYQFLPLHGYYSVCESGRQTILGACFYQGAEKKGKIFSTRLYWGTGLRFSWNDVYWERHGLTSHPDEAFNRKLLLPSVDVGIIFYYEAAGK